MSSSSNGTRLPGTQSAGKGSEVLVGILAFIGTFLVVVGLPLFLLSAFGTPWPDTAPSVEWLTRPVTADTVFAVLAAVVWLAWAHFVVCLAVEADGGDPAPRSRSASAGRGHRHAAARPSSGRGDPLLAGTAAVSAAPATAASAPATSPTTTVSAFTTSQLLGMGNPPTRARVRRHLDRCAALGPSSTGCLRSTRSRRPPAPTSKAASRPTTTSSRPTVVTTTRCGTWPSATSATGCATRRSGS